MTDSPNEATNALDVRGLAEMLNISTDKAYQLGNDPTFPSFKVGNRHRFWPEEVREFYKRPRDPWKQSAKSLGRKRVGR